MSESVAPSKTFGEVCRNIAERIIDESITDEDGVERVKREECSKVDNLSDFPRNNDVIQHTPDSHRDYIEKALQRKPVRTISGVSPVAIMTSPKMCPHGKCLYCPGGPASEFSSSQAYTGHEPAAARGKHTDYDPYLQTILRLEQLRNIGHPVNKIELIVMGGTMTSRSHDYQVWFVKRALQAMNDYSPETVEPNPSNAERLFKPEKNSWEYLENVKTKNETNNIRCIGITFETKPDWCGQEQIDRMLRLGGTKTEIGVQTTYERINREMHRGHGVEASITANKKLRDSGFKVGFHMMPGQPGMSKEMCIQDFKEIYSQPTWKPDYLKIYPTLVVEGTRVYDSWHNGEFNPLSSDEAATVVAKAMKNTPPYVRIQRVQRDIPADYIEGGVQKSNLRQLAWQKLEEMNESCNCIRCREVGHADGIPTNVELDSMQYSACGGEEYFISIEDFDKNILVGFARLRIPDNPHREELSNDTAIVRELHVYGNETEIGSVSNTDWQHQGYGQQLIRKAEHIAEENGFSKISVISGIGVREYYRNKLDYHQDGIYVSKKLN